MIPVARPFLGEDEETGVLEVLRSGWITQGPRVAQFEERFAQYVGCDYAIAVSSCTTALQLALWAVGIKAGDEVICPSLSFVATANSIAYNGASPVFADIDQDTFNIDPDKIEAVITPRTKAILAVHQIGLPADMKAKLIGSPEGDLACFSFHPRKIMTTGEGGMITTNDADLAARLKRLRQHAMSLSDVARHHAKQIAAETYDEIGFNYRMTDIQAALGIAQLGRLPGFLERRRHLAQRYSDALQDLSWLKAPYIPANCRHNFQSYMACLVGPAASKRDLIMQSLLDRKISTRRAIMAIHREIPYDRGRWEDQLPCTNLVADTGIILPLFHQMAETEQDYVIQALLDISL
jgi:dTDP-4-amino-4,6-dideoxygalactose transaminase